MKKINSMLDYSDKYSYYIYITHHIFILGPFSILMCLDLIVAIIPVIILIVISSLLLYYLSTQINNLNNKIIHKRTY